MQQQNHHRLLLNALTNPECLLGYTASDWELLIRLARRVKLLGRLAIELNKKGLLEQIPVRAANQLRSSLIQAKKLQQLTHWELNRVLWALQDMDIPIIILKGVAYSLAGLPEAYGRTYVDLDLMVTKHDMPWIESVLKKKGWRHHKLSAYDEHYYRVWSHEIPPLIHIERETEVDIHHNLASSTSKLKINADLLFENAVALHGTNIKILSPEDMALHCAINLFQHNEFADDLRDLLDFHDLIQYFSNKDPNFWSKLIDRSNRLQAGIPLSYGLYFSQLIFKTVIPPEAINDVNEKPGRIAAWMMHNLVPQALFPVHPDKSLKQAEMARFLLYLRSHWMRMPLHILIPHLIYKSFLAILPERWLSSR